MEETFQAEVTAGVKEGGCAEQIGRPSVRGGVMVGDKDEAGEKIQGPGHGEFGIFPGAHPGASDGFKLEAGCSCWSFRK